MYSQTNLALHGKVPVISTVHAFLSQIFMNIYEGLLIAILACLVIDIYIGADTPINRAGATSLRVASQNQPYLALTDHFN